jgi:hypothetical protein
VCIGCGSGWVGRGRGCGRGYGIFWRGFGSGEGLGGGRWAGCGARVALWLVVCNALAGGRNDDCEAVDQNSK